MAATDILSSEYNFEETPVGKANKKRPHSWQCRTS